MLVVFDSTYKGGDVDRALLRYWSDWMNRLKRHQKHIQRIYGRSEHCQQRREARVIAAEIEVLRTCIRQIEFLRKMRAETRRRRFTS